MCNSRLGKGSKKKCVRVFVSGSTRSHSPAQDLGQFKVNVNPFNHNLKIILTSGGDGSFWAFFFSIRSKIKESCVTLYSDMSLIING